MPTGTGDCCTPKLLHYAATHGLKPLAMAEFWWGSSSVNQDKVQGEFYGACVGRCQPLMGFLLSGLSQGYRGGEGEGEKSLSIYRVGLDLAPFSVCRQTRPEIRASFRFVYHTVGAQGKSAPTTSCIVPS
jgi:hypothetical protein